MSSVRVRMYRQGLGDCFLLTFPGKSDQVQVHMLIDCGVLLGTDESKAKMQKVAQNIVDETGGTLDVLVVTHEHWDHLSGFEQARELLGPAKLKVGEVWFGWTEKPGDATAAALRQRRARTLKRVVSATNKLAGAVEFGAKRTEARLKSLLEFWGGLAAAKQRGTHAALEWVRGRTAPKLPRYLEPGCEPITVPGVEGIRIYVLGPPRDVKRLRKSDPSKKDSEVYELAGAENVDSGFFAALDPVTEGATQEGQPFEEWFRISEPDAQARAFFRDGYCAAAEEWRCIEQDWLGVAGRLALQLDSDTNNTSLVLAFELIDSGRVLLFPGDAQVGNWLSWHEGIEWKVEHKGNVRTVNAKDLLERTVLYKVGHHGSHNATLREKGLELMVSEHLTAMIPVNRASAKKMDWNMPFPSLFGRLEERCRGRILDLERGILAAAAGATAPEWNPFPGKAEATDDWLDLHINM